MSAQEHANASAAAAASFKSAYSRVSDALALFPSDYPQTGQNSIFLSDSVRIRFIDKTCASDLSLLCIASSGFAATG